MTDREIMQQALEALTVWEDSLHDEDAIAGWRFSVVGEKAITALRERLAQPEQWEQLYPDMGNPLDRMAENARELGLDYEPVQEPVQEPEQKPVAWFDKEFNSVRWRANLRNCDLADQQPLYTAPPRREWQGLTDDDLKPVCDEYRILFGGWVHDFARAIEAKLREKNAQ